MILERVRLQRKFALKGKIKPGERLTGIAETMVVFELGFILTSCLLSLSLHFHLHHLFTTEFWTAEAIVNSNLSLAICVFLLLPYLIFWLQIQGSAIKDYVATVLTLHLLVSTLINLYLTLAYAVFLGVVGAVGAVLGGYGAVIRQQKKLIAEVQRIEGADRKEQGLAAEQCERTHLHMSDN